MRPRLRTSATASALLLLALGSPLSGQQTEPDCRDPQLQSEMNLCAIRDFRSADAEMNRAYASLRAALRPEDRERLAEVQRAWLRFRDQQCDFEAAGYEGGTMKPLIRFSCLAALTNERVRHLRNMREIVAPGS